MGNFITRLTVTLAALMGVCSISGQTDTCKRCQRLMNRNEGYIATAMDKGFDFGPSVKADFAWAATVGSTRDVPEGTTCSANRFGARPDTTHLSTKAIQKAIDACARRGGGTVTLLPGSYLTGALYVRSGVNLHLDAGVKLVASRRLDDFPDIDTRVAGIEMRWPSAVINILDAQGAAVTGSGTIDCRGEWCWNRYWTMRPGYERQGLRWAVDYDCKRVRGILVQRSEDVTLRGFTLLRTGFWGCQMLYSSHCTADGLTIDNNMGSHGPSTDGIDIDSSDHMLVENCYIDCNDDDICLKAGRDWDGLRVNRPCEFVVVRGCTSRRGGALIACGSETSGWIRNILAYSNKAQGTSNVLRIKSSLTRGGGVENVYVTDVEAQDVAHLLSADLNWNTAYSYSTLPKEYLEKQLPDHWTAMLHSVEPAERGFPRVRNICLSHVEATNVGEFVHLSGVNEQYPLENVYLYDLDVQGQHWGSIKHTVNYNVQKARLDIADNARNGKTTISKQ
jgi:hypothetical protein